MSATQAAQFLDHLTQGEPATFQTFDDTGAKRKQLSSVMHGNLCNFQDRMQSLNEKGAGIFVMVNAGDLKGRKQENVKQVRSVFVDLDGSPLEPVLECQLQPHIVVESSPNRYHAYWLIDDLPLTEFRAAQETLALRFNSDPAVKDLPRVMRLPGFMHRKQEPCLTKLLTVNSTGRYHRSDLIDAFGFDPSIAEWRGNTVIQEGKRNNTLFSMALGFVNHGFNSGEVVSRLHKINQKRCTPPLSDDEIKTIASQAHSYGAAGTLNVDYRLVDSVYQKLSCGAVKLDIVARRIAKGNPEVAFSLLKQDMEKWGFGNPKTLRKYREELIKNNMLREHRPPHYGQNSAVRECGLYRIGVPKLW